MEGRTSSRKDDLQCMLYTVAFLRNSKLPWFDPLDDEILSAAEIQALKESTTSQDLFSTLPPDFDFLFNYI